MDDPPYSPDLVRSDFYPFGKGKGAFDGQEFDSTKEFPLGIRVVTDHIKRAELESVFDAWKRRLGQCIRTRGEYIISGRSQRFWITQYSYPQTEMLENHA
jgi:hypothetical protein